jgi:arabinan endo-1,5-alpha-L-arabinosidase
MLLPHTPTGDYTIETKLTINLGTHTIRNYQQAGLIAYTHDNRYIRLAHTAIWNTRQTEYAKEQPHAGKPAYGSMTIGPPTTTTWLRLHHTTHRGEHHIQALTSRNGKHWTPGGTWTTPTTHPLHYGLHSMGGKGATTHFHYIHTYTH